MEGFINDELLIYRGKDIFVKDGIIIHQPTLDEICECGEREYWQMVHNFTSVGADMKFQLFDMGIDYTKISDFELFYSMLYHLFENRRIIFFNCLDLTKFKLFRRDEDNAVIMYDEDSDTLIDEYTYLLMTDVIRKIHGMKRNDKIPANESTKQILIDDARDEYEMNKNKEHHSQLKNMISTMINSEGFKYNHEEVWNMKIGAFMDSVKRISKIKNADLLLQSGYSGYGINLKDVNKKQIDWLGELD